MRRRSHAVGDKPRDISFPHNLVLLSQILCRVNFPPISLIPEKSGQKRKDGL